VPKLVDHEVRRRQVVDAVLRLIRRDGVEAVTIRHVAAESGWAPGVLAHYFRDKDALLLAAFRRVADGVTDRTIRQRVAGPPLSLLRWFCRNILPLDRERRAEVQVWYAFLGHALARPALAAAQREVYRQWRQALADILRAAGERGELAPGVEPAAEAASLVAFIDGLALQALFEPEAFPPDRQAALLDARLGAVRRGGPAAATG
jgi:AcrR family transcriptional regulator